MGESSWYRSWPCRIAIYSFIFSGLLTPFAHATDDDDVFQAVRPSVGAAGKLQKKAYIGARDEQRLEIQATLPQPSRSPDGTAVVLDEADEPVVTPVSD